MRSSQMAHYSQSVYREPFSFFYLEGRLNSQLQAFGLSSLWIICSKMLIPAVIPSQFLCSGTVIYFEY